MTANQYVRVMAQFGDGVNWAPGNYSFISAGTLMESSAVAIVTPVILGQLDSLGAFSSVGAQPNTGILILASDNFAAGELNWDVTVKVQNLPDIIVENVPILFSLGATQGLFSILEATGWTATVVT
jgi:hypothetical protein